MLQVLRVMVGFDKKLPTKLGPAGQPDMAGWLFKQGASEKTPSGSATKNPTRRGETGGARQQRKA